jgi:hypothetical protein
MFDYHDNGNILFWCPGCKTNHVINNNWKITGLKEKPTVSPSVLVQYDYGKDKNEKRCHLFIKNGMIEYLNDCTHELKGKTVPMETT